MNNNELYHFGIKGMKWGVRRTPAQLGHPTSSSVKSKKQIKKEQKELKKKQKEWDDNVKKNSATAYNKAADYANKVLIPKINEKYKDYDFSDLSDPKIRKVYDNYIEEYEYEFEDYYGKTLKEMFGERPK